MKKIVILSATRAEYGLLKRVIIKLRNHPGVEARIVVTGAHLSDAYGNTYKEIVDDGITIHKTINILTNEDSPLQICKSMAKALSSFGEYFQESQPDALIVLGDRYETLAVCCAAMNMRIPILHICGGETTEGALDEAIRHSITKMSFLHFTTTEIYRKRVIQLGEDPERVFCVGSLGVENIMKEQLMSLKQLEDSIEFDLSGGYAVVTFHPVSLENSQAGKQFKELLSTLGRFKMKYIITKANADFGGREINRMIDEYAEHHRNVFAIESLGMKRYLSAVRSARLVIGNSSSGISEVPSFHIPTINIGDRQRGRIQAASVINCKPEREDIFRAINKGLSENFMDEIKDIENPYGDGNSSDKIIEAIEKNILDGVIDLKKKFYDIEFKCG